MVKHFLFKDRDGQTPLPFELQKDLIPKHVQTIGELDEYEEENIAEGLVWLARYSGQPISYTFWLKLHKSLFSNVWKWAGKIRTHELSHPDFFAPYEIWPALKQLETDTLFWTTQKSIPGRELAARFHERIETIHPFANGNGRFGRILTEYICHKENFEIPTWGKSLQQDPGLRRKTYVNSLDHARRRSEYAPLISIMFS